MVTKMYKSKARRGRTGKRRMRLSYKIKRQLREPYLRVRRTFWNFNWVPGTAATSDFWRYITFSANLIPNISEYTNLFDTYRVNSFTVTLRPRYDSFAGNDTTDTTLPGVTNQGGNHVHVIIDPSSPISTPSGTYVFGTLNSFLENGKVRTYDGTKTISIKVKYPCFVDDINNTAASDYKRSTWITTNNTGVSHRGVHMFIQDVNFTGAFGQSYDVFYTVDISFKGSR